MNTAPGNASSLAPLRSGSYPDLGMAWLEKWRRPKGAQAVKAWLGLLALILAVGALIYETGGTALVWVHLMYVPIILASGIFGLRGGLLSALIGGLLLGPFVVVDVEDTGPGIPLDLLDKLFDPFFTTKAVGSGTGLGLSVSRKIVELHGASIKLGNRKPKGAAARIIFKLS